MLLALVCGTLGSYPFTVPDGVSRIVRIYSTSSCVVSADPSLTAADIWPSGATPSAVNRELLAAANGDWMPLEQKVYPGQKLYCATGADQILVLLFFT